MNNRTSEVQYARDTMASGFKVFLFFKGARSASDVIGNICAFLACIPLFFIYVLCIVSPVFLIKKITGQPMLWGIHDFGDCVDRAFSKLIMNRDCALSPRALRKATTIITSTQEGQDCLKHMCEHGMQKQETEQ